MSFAGAVSLAIGFALPPEGVPHLTMCWFYAVTGLPCPACGLTRSFSAILHAEFALAWRMNPFGYVAVVTALFFLFGPLVRRFFPRLNNHLARPSVLSSFLWVMLGALLLFGCVRLFLTWHPELGGILHLSGWDPS